jgi:hypothetical protein
MTASPKVPTITLDSSLRGRSVEVDGRESAARKELMNLPSSSMRGGRRPKIWKKSGEETDTHDDKN